MKLTLQQVDNSIFEALRLRIVAAGYFPDEAAFLPADTSGFEAAKQTIRDSGKRLIELFNTGSRKATGKRNNNAVIIRRMPKRAASTGTSPQVEYSDKGGGRFDKLITTGSKYDLTYQITYNCDLEEDGDVIEQFLVEAFGGRKFIPAIDSNGDQIGNGEFFLLQAGSINTDSTKFIERGYIYSVWNIDLEGDRVIGEVNEFTEFVFEEKFDIENPAEGDPDFVCVIGTGHYYKSGYIKTGYFNRK